jgi:hypothetical protein
MRARMLLRGGQLREHAHRFLYHKLRRNPWRLCVIERGRFPRNYWRKDTRSKRWPGAGRTLQLPAHPV